MLDGITMRQRRPSACDSSDLILDVDDLDLVAIWTSTDSISYSASDRTGCLIGLRG